MASTFCPASVAIVPVDETDTERARFFALLAELDLCARSYRGALDRVTATGDRVFRFDGENVALYFREDAIALVRGYGFTGTFSGIRGPGLDGAVRLDLSLDSPDEETAIDALKLLGVSR